MKNNNYNSLNRILLAALFLLFISACRFTVPTNKETSALNDKGSFTSGAPAWAKLPKDQQVNLPANTGIVPQTFTVPESASFSAQANSSTALGANVGKGLAMDSRSISVAKQKNNLEDQSSIIKNPANNLELESSNDSELGKIESLCPGTENAVEDAIKTENVNARIKKYLLLTKRCPNSSSVWTWLAKDYRLVGRNDDAKRCAQAAITIDPNNSTASSIINELNSN